jgi:hypothetical protein
MRLESALDCSRAWPNNPWLWIPVKGHCSKSGGELRPRHHRWLNAAAWSCCRTRVGPMAAWAGSWTSTATRVGGGGSDLLKAGPPRSGRLPRGGAASRRPERKSNVINPDSKAASESIQPQFVETPRHGRPYIKSEPVQDRHLAVSKTVLKEPEEQQLAGSGP